MGGRVTTTRHDYKPAVAALPGCLWMMACDSGDLDTQLHTHRHESSNASKQQSYSARLARAGSGCKRREMQLDTIKWSPGASGTPGGASWRTAPSAAHGRPTAPAARPQMAAPPAAPPAAARPQVCRIYSKAKRARCNPQNSRPAAADQGNQRRHCTPCLQTTHICRALTAVLMERSEGGRGMARVAVSCGHSGPLPSARSCASSPAAASYSASMPPAKFAEVLRV
jgi:hypothetical protein